MAPRDIHQYAQNLARGLERATAALNRQKADTTLLNVRNFKRSVDEIARLATRKGLPAEMMEDWENGMKGIAWEGRDSLSHFVSDPVIFKELERLVGVMKSEVERDINIVSSH